MLDLADIRRRNDGQPEGYWKATTAALCDEVERLQRPPDHHSDIDAVLRMIDGGMPVPSWMVRCLCERVELAEYRTSRILIAARAWSDAIERRDGIAAAEQALREVVRELRA